jgi:hypothetical protein
MAKPILVIRFPLGDWKRINDQKSLVKNIALQIDYEYHILLCPDQLIDSIQFEVHSTNNNTPIDLKDLEERLSILTTGAKEIIDRQGEKEEEILEKLRTSQIERFKNYGK